MNKKALFSLSLIALILPIIAFAAVTDINSLMSAIVDKVLWTVFVGFVVICFVMAGILFLSSFGDPSKISQAKSAFVWGIVGIIVGFLAYSITAMLKGVLG